MYKNGEWSPPPSDVFLAVVECVASTLNMKAVEDVVRKGRHPDRINVYLARFTHNILLALS